MAKNTGHNADSEFVRLRGRLRVDDPVEKQRRRDELERYLREKKIREAQAVLAAAWSENGSGP
jgi:hypothetical protein